MKTISYSSGEVIFHEGEFELTMFDILKGSVAIYLDYDSEQRQLLTVLKGQQLLGGMGLIEACPRSATAVAMEDDTTLQEIREEEFYASLQHNPERLLQIMRQMSARIRENTVKYRDTCRRSFLISTGYLSISTMRKQFRTMLCAMDTEPCVSVKRMSIG